MTLAKEGSRKRKKETFTISFRVDAHHLGQLEKGATPYGISVHEYARQRLTELLDRQDEVRLLQETAAIRKGLDGLRDDLAATLEIILINTSKAPPEEQKRIHSWIDKHLRKESKEE